MSTFWYKFRYIDLSGKKHTDSIKADSIKAARQYIISKRYKLLSIRRQYEIELYLKRFKKTKAYAVLLTPKLTRNEVYWMTKELHEFLASGIPLLESLYALKGFSKSKRYQKILDTIIYEIEFGKPLSNALEQFPTSFPKYYIIAIKSGESVGRLSESLKSNAETLSWVNENRTKIIQATFFPFISLILIIGSFFYSLRILVPYFITSLERLKSDIPPITQKMDKLNDFTIRYTDEFILILNALFVFLAIVSSNKKTGYYFERVIVKIPIYGKVYVYFLSTYLAKMLTLLINQRYSILNSFLLCKDLFNSPFFNKEMEIIYKKIKNGYSIGQCFDESKLFPEFMAQLIKDGEKTGTLDTKISAIADLFRARLENHVEWIMAMISPTYLIVTIVVSIFYIYAFFWPVWKIYL